MRRRATVALAVLLTATGGGTLAASSAAQQRASRIDGAAVASIGAVRRQPAGGAPAETQPFDTSRPDRVVGTGSASSCTSQAVVDAVASGGVITFDCGPDPVTIPMDMTAKVVNTSPLVVLDGGGKVTLSGQGQRRIFYMNTCDQAQVWTTSHCQNQQQPQLVIQGLTFTGGDSTGDTTEGGGGGAVFVRGGQLTVLDSAFVGNRCDPTGPDLGGAGLRVLSQYEGRPVVVARTRFEGNVCANGGGISSIGVSWRIFDSAFTRNDAIGNGANPSRPGTPGGGSGGAISLDGNRFTLELFGTTITDNAANEGGGAIFFVSNDRTGELRITGSTLQRNVSRGFQTAGYPGIFYLGAGSPVVTDSVIE
jgi:hypothetical protein